MKLGHVLNDGYSLRKNYSTTMTPNNELLTCCSFPLDDGDSVHSEVALISIYQYMYDELPPYILNWRTIANGEIREACPCESCVKYCLSKEINSVELLINNNNEWLCKSCNLQTYQPQKSSANRRRCGMWSSNNL